MTTIRPEAFAPDDYEPLPHRDFITSVNEDGTHHWQSCGYVFGELAESEFSHGSYVEAESDASTKLSCIYKKLTEGLPGLIIVDFNEAVMRRETVIQQLRRHASKEPDLDDSQIDKLTEFRPTQGLDYIVTHRGSSYGGYKWRGCGHVFGAVSESVPNIFEGDTQSEAQRFAFLKLFRIYKKLTEGLPGLRAVNFSEMIQLRETAFDYLRRVAIYDIYRD